MKNTNYKYDIAFAFLEKDEHLVNQINNLLINKFKIFLNSKKQEYKDDLEREMLLLDVFKKQSRCVVLLYGNKWGTTPYTAIEEKAVRTRISEEGNDNLLVISLDNPPVVPKYLSKTQIWTEIAQAGINGTAAFIEEQVRALGGGLSEELPLNSGTEIKKEPRFEVESSKFLESVSGLEIAVIELKKLFSALESEKNKITESDKGISLTLKRDEKNCVVHFGDLSIRFYLQTEKSNLLMDSPLYFEMQKQNDTSNRLNILAVEEYHFELKKVGVYGWIKGADSDSFVSSKQLAEDSIKLLLTQK
jgi:hypothetical protein